jgi:phosphoribosylformimino-5-aminoimidazole carboxamide ribotide isomerase
VLIPSIDLQGGRIVQLVGGRDLAYATDDIDGWIDRLTGFPLVQVIDLDAALGTGENPALVRRIASALPCQVGGGLRRPQDAEAALRAGARRVIVGSALFDERGVNTGRAAEFVAAVGADRLVAAVDSRGGRTVVDGWRATLAVSATDAISRLGPCVRAFLATIVDDEGRMTGINMDAVRRLREATDGELIVAGGISTREEIDRLDALSVHAVVGMAIYTGAIDLAALNPGRPHG